MGTADSQGHSQGGRNQGGHSQGGRNQQRRAGAFAGSNARDARAAAGTADSSAGPEFCGTAAGEGAGMIPQALAEVFAAVEAKRCLDPHPAAGGGGVRLKMSFLEIYNEEIR